MSSIPEKLKIDKYYLYVIMVIILGVVLRFFLLTNQSLWVDEGLSLSNSDVSTLQESISRVREIPNSDRFQPLYFIVLFGWRKAFGDTEFALRSLSAILGVGSIVVVFFTSLRIYGKNHALWSSLILALSSFCIYYSQEVRNYALLIFLASLQLYFFSYILTRKETNKGTSRWFFGVFTAIGLFGSITMFPFTVALCLSHFAIYRNLRQWLQWWIPAAFFSVPAILYYLSLPGATNPASIAISRTGFPIVQNAIFVLYGILVGITYGPSQEQLRGDDKIQVVFSYLPHLIILIVVVSVIFIVLAKTLLMQNNKSCYYRADCLFACLFVTSFFLGLLLAVVTKMNWVPRHSFYLCLPLAILIPSSFSKKYRHNLKLYRQSQYALIAVIFLLILNIYSLFNYYFNENYSRDDYRSAAQYLIKNRDYSRQSVILSGEPTLLKYYGDNLTINGLNLGAKLMYDKKFAGNLAKSVKDLTKNIDTVFIVVNREHTFPEGSIEREMNNLYTLNYKVHFPYFNIYRFTRKGN